MTRNVYSSLVHINTSTMNTRVSGKLFKMETSEETFW